MAHYSLCAPSPFIFVCERNLMIVYTTVSVPSRYAARRTGAVGRARGLIGGPPEWAAGEPLDAAADYVKPETARTRRRAAARKTFRAHVDESARARARARKLERECSAARVC